MSDNVNVNCPADLEGCVLTDFQPQLVRDPLDPAREPTEHMQVTSCSVCGQTWLGDPEPIEPEEPPPEPEPEPEP